jgi:hypothetical protein
MLQLYARASPRFVASGNRFARLFPAGIHYPHKFCRSSSRVVMDHFHQLMRRLRSGALLLRAKNLFDPSHNNACGSLERLPRHPPARSRHAVGRAQPLRGRFNLSTLIIYRWLGGKIGRRFLYLALCDGWGECLCHPPFRLVVVRSLFPARAYGTLVDCLSAANIAGPEHGERLCILHPASRFPEFPGGRGDEE